jgi:hypothetical protein
VVDLAVAAMAVSTTEVLTLPQELQTQAEAAAASHMVVNQQCQVAQVS